MPQHRELALIVAKPGQVRDGLEAVLMALPRVDRVESTDGGSAALNRFIACPPSIVLLDSDLEGDDATATLRQVKTLWPATRCLVLVDDIRQQGEADAEGADAVLLKGGSAARLLETIRTLLPESET